MTVQQQQQIPTDIEIQSGLDFIIHHFDPTILYFPRTIMTKKSNGQIVIYAKGEALQYFKESECQDCRINAYRYSPSSFNSIEQWTPDLLFIDIDRSDFKSDTRCKLALSNTLKNIKKNLGNDSEPTVLFTGGGYHIYQPVYIPTALENITEFQDFDRPSEQFLRFAKDYLSNGNADKQNNPSFKSCLLRVPGSINSKYDTQVKIVQKWNGVRPPIPREFIEEFRTYLIQKKIDEAKQRQKNLNMRRNKIRNNNNSNYNINYYYEWIDEKILANPFPDYRKLIINLILAPYLAVIKELSYEESYQIINEWLHKCDLRRELDFNPKTLINTAIATAYKKQIPPMSIITLKTNYKDLYYLLEQKGKGEGTRKQRGGGE